MVTRVPTPPQENTSDPEKAMPTSASQRSYVAPNKLDTTNLTPEQQAEIRRVISDARKCIRSMPEAHVPHDETIHFRSEVPGSDSEKASSNTLDQITVLNTGAPPLRSLGGSFTSQTTASSSQSESIDEKTIADEKELSNEKTDSPEAEAAQPGVFRRTGRSIRDYIDRHYILTNSNPAIVLPKAPSDKEKYCYVNTRRPWFLCIGILAFLAASAGLWLFTISYPAFYWFGVVATLIQLHIILSYGFGIFSRDFSVKAHDEILKEFPIAQDSCPSVDVYLPVCKEPLVVLQNTWNHVSKLRYPAGKLQVHVLDDGALDEVKALADSFGYNYIRREDRPYFRKAGNLRHAFAKTKADFFVIYDADFCPRDDFLLETVPRMLHDSNIAIIQTPQYFKTYKENTWVERGASECQELFYRWSQVNRDKFNGAICVGSNALYRREALTPVGGTALVAASEDVHTGFYAITRGWRLRYIPLCLAAGISPDTPRAVFSQQIRWSQGSTSLLLNGDFHKAKLGVMTKLCFLSGMLYYWTTAISMFTMPLPGILITWVRPDVLRYYNLAFALPSIIYGLLIFRIWSAGSLP